jgi:short-subunit dehydrogenase
MNFTNTLKYIGGIYLTYKAISFLKWSFQFLPSTSNSLQSKYGNGWVIITGGSSGIGLSYAKAFLSLNYNVCILSHSSDKLNSAYETLTQLNPTSSQVRYIKYDLNRDYDENDYNELTNKIMKATDNGNISILINNAGVITRGNLITNSIAQITSMININIKATVFLTKLILTIHKRKNNNHKLLIITSGSIAGKGRYAGRSVYSGTKYFLESFMESIAKENKDDIDCTCFEIGPVETEMNKVDVKFKLQSDDFVNKALTYIGKGNIIRSGCFTHEMYIRLREIGIIEGLIDNMIIPKKL